MFYTLGQAAKATGKSKPTIQRALKSGRMSGNKNDVGEWEIDPSELHRVFPAVSSSSNSNSPTKQPETPNVISLLQRENELLREQVNDLKADKVFLQSELKKATLLLTGHQEQPQASKSFWQRLFR